MLYNQVNIGKKETLFFSCDYDEVDLNTYKGIKVSYLKNDSKNILYIISTGNVENDIKAAMEKFKDHSIVFSSRIDNYQMDYKPNWKNEDCKK